MSLPNRDEMITEIETMVQAMNELPNVDAQLRWLDMTGWMMPRDAIALGEMLNAKDELIEDLTTGAEEVAA